MQSTTLQLTPIGYFKSLDAEKYTLPRQAGAGKTNVGKIVLNPHFNYEQALEDLDGFDRLWAIFWFHKNTHWSPKVLTPHGPPKRGLFATRSPHRPNPLGLSCLDIIEIKGLEIMVGNHDLLPETPILDIKPYIEYADAWLDTKQGWLNDQTKAYLLQWNPLALDQLAFLEKFELKGLKDDIHLRLSIHPFPTSNNRIIGISDNCYRLAYKTWRIDFQIFEKTIQVLSLSSGYDKDTLLGLKSSRWDDVPLHLAFNERFRIF